MEERISAKELMKLEKENNELIKEVHAELGNSRSFLQVILANIPLILYMVFLCCMHHFDLIGQVVALFFLEKDLKLTILLYGIMNAMSVLIIHNSKANSTIKLLAAIQNTGFLIGICFSLCCLV